MKSAKREINEEVVEIMLSNKEEEAMLKSRKVEINI